MAYVSSISFGNNGRSILPDGFNLTSDIKKFTLECAQLGEGDELLSDNREWTENEDSGLSAYSVMFADITENKIPLVAGTSWQFTIKAFKFASDANPVLEKTVSQEIVSGANPINFGVLNESAGNGSLEITLSFPSDAGATRVVANLKDIATGTSVSSQTFNLPDDVDSTNGNFSSIFFSADPSHGNYKVDFTFTIVNGRTTTQCVSEFVRIATGLKSTGHITINDLNSVYTVGYHPNGVDMPAGRVWPETYSPLDPAVTLPTLAKTGAEFAGWYESSNYGGSPVTTFAGGARGNKEFYVKWDYEMTGNTISACGAHAIIKASNGKTYCYFDVNGNGEADADEVVLAENNGQPLDITGYTVYGGSESGSYSGATYVTLESGNLNAVYGGNGTGSVTNTNVEIKGGAITNAVYGGSQSGSVSGTATLSVSGGSINTVYGGGSESSSSTAKAVLAVSGGSVDYLFAGADSGSVQTAELAIGGGSVGFVYAGGKNNAVSGNSSIAVSGGTILDIDCGKKDSKVGGTSVLTINGASRIGSSSTNNGVHLDTVTGGKVLVGDVASAQAASITLIADHSNITEGTVVATFTEGTADAGKFSLLRDDTGGTVNVNASGNDIVTIGSFELPDPSNVTWTGNDEFTLGTGNVTTGGTIFSVFADGGYLTVTETALEGANFDMGIPLDENYKENGYDNTLSANKKYRYIQFTSETGNITAKNADTYLSKIRFHSIGGASVKVRINLETLPITGAGYTLNQDVFYFDGSFYKKSAKFNSGATSWPAAYAAAKKMTFNGLKGYLMTITSDAENKFVYDQVFKGQNADDVGSWIGGTRQTSIEGYDKDTWTAKTSKSDYTQNWVWACGPEAGKVFYTKAVYQDNNNYRADGMYSSWSNPKDCDLNGIPRAYNDDYEPNNQADGNHSSSNPDTTTPKEYYTQYTGRYVWNDASNGTGTQPRWQVHYYIVEFTPYEATAYGPGQRATKTALHAEREYSRN